MYWVDFLSIPMSVQTNLCLGMIVLWRWVHVKGKLIFKELLPAHFRGKAPHFMGNLMMQCGIYSCLAQDPWHTSKSVLYSKPHKQSYCLFSVWKDLVPFLFLLWRCEQLTLIINHSALNSFLSKHCCLFRYSVNVPQALNVFISSVCVWKILSLILQIALFYPSFILSCVIMYVRMYVDAF